MAEGYKDFIAGTVGGFSGKVFDYPLDTVKVLLQTQNSLSSRTSPTSISTKADAASSATIQSTAAPPQKVYRGAIHCLQHQIKTRGFLSLYQGIASPLAGSMAENAVLFLCYGEIKRMLGEKPGEKELSLLQLATAGGVAGGMAAVVLNPFEVIKGVYKSAACHMFYPYICMFFSWCLCIIHITFDQSTNSFISSDAIPSDSYSWSLIIATCMLIHTYTYHTSTNAGNEFSNGRRSS